MISHRDINSLAAASLTAAAMVFGPSAHAQQRGNPCAIYGSDFVAVQGSGSCVRIGGRVRLEMSTGKVGNAYAPSPLTGAPAAMAPFGNAQTGNPLGAGDGLNRAHMRIGAPGQRR